MAFLMPGPFEMLIILFILAVLVVPVLILIVLLAAGKLGSSKRNYPPCSSCGGWTHPNTRYCPHCGNPINAPEQPADSPGE